MADGSPASLVSLIQHAQQQEQSSPSLLGKRKRPVGKRAALSSASFYVPKLVAQPEGMRLSAMYSGHLPASYALNADPSLAESDAHLFFLLVKARHIPDRQRLVIWFNGGPGCSSFDGALLEIGPVLVRSTGDETTLVDNPGRWNEYADILFIDQPAGTGYSYITRGKAVGELAPAASQIVTFLSNFYSVFPEYSKMDTFIAGESYAGTTIPYLAKALNDNKSVPTRLKGLIMGNGWFSPVQQYPAYVKYGQQRGLIKPGSDEAAHVDKLMLDCNQTLSGPLGKGHVLVGACEALIDGVMRAGKTTIDESQYCIGSYDVRPTTYCGEYPQGLKVTTPYLQQSQVVDTLHATGKTSAWVQCNNTVGAQMWSPHSLPSVTLIPSLLEQMPMLFFAGDADLMCNWVGIQDTLDNMTWKGATGFGANTTAKEWYVNGTLAGTWKEERNVTWVVVKDAGHMVPIDQPYAAHDLLLRFMGVQTLDAAGDASRIPSRIGRVGSTTTDDSIIGKIAPDGGTLPGVLSSHSEAAAAAASSLAAAVDQAGEFGFGATTGDGIVFDKERELTYGPRRTAVLVVIIAVTAVGFCALLRWRARSRRSAARKWAMPHVVKSRSGIVGPDQNGEGIGLSKLANGRSRAQTLSRSRKDTENALLERIEEHEVSGIEEDGGADEGAAFLDDKHGVVPTRRL